MHIDELLTDICGCRDDFMTIATTRPETLFGDVTIAVNPEV
jgi:valyl-tRNA synthetase